MKKFIIAVLVILILLVAGCTRSIYDNNRNLNNLGEPGTDYNHDYANDAKNFWPEYVVPDNGTENQQQNAEFDNFFRTNNIADYRYTTNGNNMRIWINNWDNMAADVQTRIRNQLMNLNRNIRNIEFVPNQNELNFR